jgi:hypothetical protein
MPWPVPSVDVGLTVRGGNAISERLARVDDYLDQDELCRNTTRDPHHATLFEQERKYAARQRISLNLE